MKAARVEPSHAHLVRAFNRLQSPSWPATLEAALKDRSYERLIHGLAVNFARREMRPDGRPPSPLRTSRAQGSPRAAAPRPLAFDPKRAAANDRDD